MTTTTKAGRLHPDLSFPEYLAHPAYGSSDLRTFRAGPPALVPWRRQFREETQSDASRLGTAAHCAILTPALFASTYVSKPEGMSFASNVGKAWREEQRGRGVLDENILTFHEALAIEQIRTAFYERPQCRETLRDATVEASIFWTCAHSGLPLKSRPDWFKGSAVYDLKVSTHAAKDLGALKFLAYREGWMHQLAHARSACRAAGFAVAIGRLVVIAPKPPQALKLWCLEVSEHNLDVLQLDNENTARDMKVFHDSGVWPGTPEEWIEVEPPADNLLADLDEEEVDQ